MSNALAIAAVTATLRNRLFGAVTVGDLAGTEVTVAPPDRARSGVTGTQLNLFLYETVAEPFRRSHGLPAADDGSGQAPLSLSLRYLLTAYRADEGDQLDPIDHRLLGLAMRALHDAPVLGGDELRRALAGNDVHAQPERVRITPHALSLDEMSRLWGGFQTQYRISTAYQACVVLIDASRPGSVPLPVLTRGPGDSGPVASAETAPTVPTLESVGPRELASGVLPGERVVLRGGALGNVVEAMVTERRTGATATLARAEPDPDEPPDEAVAVVLPDGDDALPSGVHTVAVRDAADRVSNELALALAPRITSPLPLEVARGQRGEATIVLDCVPAARAGQPVLVIVGDRAVPDPALTARGRISVVLPHAVADTHRLRLRIDGVESRSVDRRTDPPAFDARQVVVIT